MISCGTKRWLLVFTVLCPLSSLLGQTQFVPLGFFGSSGPSEANAITRDGSKIIGYSATNLTENQACWWTAAGIAPVPGMQNWYANSAYGISADGNVIVGDRSFGGTEEAWYWTPAGQIQLVPFPTAQRAAYARGVSGNGDRSGVRGHSRRNGWIEQVFPSAGSGAPVISGRRQRPSVWRDPTFAAGTGRIHNDEARQ